MKQTIAAIEKRLSIAYCNGHDTLEPVQCDREWGATVTDDRFIDRNPWPAVP